MIDTLQLESTIVDIANDLEEFVRSTDSEKNYSLFSGDAGFALFFGYLSKFSEEKKYENLAINLLERSVDSIATRNQAVAPGLLNGFSGVGLVIQHFINIGLLSNSDVLSSIDEYVDTMLTNHKEYKDCSASYGLVGLGIYYLERLKGGNNDAIDFLTRILDRIKEHSVTDKNGISWLDTIQESRIPDKKFYNLGLAHGNSGVACFLLTLHELGIDKTGNSALLATDAIRWMMEKEIANPTFSMFPSMSESIKDFRNKSRLGWCNGDLCVAIALIKAGDALGKISFKEKAHEIVKFSATRDMVTGMIKSEEHLNKYDPTFCHGTSGISFLFHRFGDYFQDKTLQQASNKWLDLTFSAKDSNAKEGAGFKNYFHSENKSAIYWDVNRGLLRGNTGIGLALLSMTDSSRPAWERFFFLDF